MYRTELLPVCWRNDCPYERLNGVLGSFHTNCCDISLQVMRKFQQINEYGIHYWPEEHKNEFAPFLSGCQYSRGSLAPISFQSTLSDDCLPLPPLREYAFPLHVKLQLTETLKKLKFFPSEFNFEIISLYQKCRSIKVGHYILGLKVSRLLL